MNTVVSRGDAEGAERDLFSRGDAENTEAQSFCRRGAGTAKDLTVKNNVLIHSARPREEVLRSSASPREGVLRSSASPREGVLRSSASPREKHLSASPRDRVLRVAIVDDEPLAREDLTQLLAGRTDVDVVATCANGAEALEAVDKVRPDVMLLDIRMPGIDGFGVVSRLESVNAPYVVFVTAFDRFAIDAFRVRALDYLLKPVQASRLEEALDRVREQLAKRSGPDWLSALQAAAQEQSGAESEYITELMVRVGTRDILVKVDEIDWIQAETYYVRLHVRGRSYLYRERMHILQERLNPRHFTRVHRSAIVNLDRVREIVHDTRGDHVVVLSTGARVKTSHQRWQEFRELMRRRTGR